MGAREHKQDSLKRQTHWKKKAKKVANGVKKAVFGERQELSEEQSHREQARYMSTYYNVGGIGYY